MRYHKGFSEKHWKFLYSLDAFLFAVAIFYMLTLILESGFPLGMRQKIFLGYINLFVIGLSLFELMIKFLLSTSKSYFFGDEFWDFLFTNLLFICVLYVGYVHFMKLGLPFHPAMLVTPQHEHFILLRIILIITVLVQFKEFNRILLGLKIQPVQLLVGGFFILVLLGTVILSLPLSTVNPISVFDALFMSTSATCVTGLITLETSTDFTFFGQIVLLVLIQVGGLGIMTLGSFIALLLRGGLGIEGRKIMGEAVEYKAHHQLSSLLGRIIRFTFVMEGIGAAIFTWRFYGQFHDFYKSLYYGIFHAISAFCNAGFALFSDSVIGFQKDPYFLITMSILIILGGIGFLVIADMRHYSKTKGFNLKHLAVQTKIVLSITAVLLVVGTALIFFLEYEGQLKHLSLEYKLLNAFFMSVSPRTAGFNSIHVGLLNPATLLTIMLLMVIGGGSGSTAGGIKVNTLGVLFSLLKATVLNKAKVIIFERTIPTTTLHKAIAITFFSALI